MTVPAQGPPVNVPIRRTAHCIMSFLQVTLKEACSDQQIFLPPAGIEPGTLSTRSQCANHSATSLPPFKLRISESVCLFKVTGDYLEKRSCLSCVFSLH